MAPDPRHSRRWRRPGIAALLAGALVLAGCAAPKPEKPGPSGGIGGTGLTDNGIGGTGLADNGIGGTGIDANGIGGTGIVGIVTAKGSLWVNGIEVTVDRRSAATRDGAAIDPEAIGVGELVALQVERDGKSVVARRADTAAALQGPVQSVDAVARTFTVLGHAVHLPQGFGMPALGSTVRVSGLRHADGTLEAARVDPGDPAVARLTGKLARPGDAWTLDGVPVALAPGLAGSAKSGQVVAASGRWNGTILAVDRLGADPVESLLARVPYLWVQGFLAAQAGGPRIQAGTQPLTLAGNTPSSLGSGPEQLAVVGGRIGADRTLQVDRIVPLTGPVTPPRAGAPPAPPTRPDRPWFVTPGGATGGPPSSPPKGPPPGTPGGPSCGTPPCGVDNPGNGPPCGTPPCGGGGGGNGPPCGTPPCGGPKAGLPALGPPEVPPGPACGAAPCGRPAPPTRGGRIRSP